MFWLTQQTDTCGGHSDNILNINGVALKEKYNDTRFTLSSN